MIYVTNAFSLNMIKSDSVIEIKISNVNEVRKILENSEFVSAIGHESTANLLTKLLNINIPFNRISIELKKHDKLIVFQLLTRLPENTLLSEQELYSLPFNFYIVHALA